MSIKKPLIFILCLLIGCCTSKNPKNNNDANTISNENSFQKYISKRPNVIKQNVTQIEAKIDSVILYNDYNFKLLMTILSVKAEEDIASFAETGQEIIAAPDYYRGENNIIDWRNERNSELLNIKNYQPGDTLNLKISLGEKGDWKIIKVMK